MESEITGKITSKDFLCVELYLIRYSFLFMWLTTILGTMVAMTLFPLNIDSYLNKAILFGIISIIGVTVFFLVIMILNQREYRSISKRLREGVIQINEEGLLYGNKGKQRTIQWNDIKKIVFLKRMILLYTRKNRPTAIPRHFFSSSAQEKEWIDFIKKHVPN